MLLVFNKSNLKNKILIFKLFCLIFKKVYTKSYNIKALHSCYVSDAYINTWCVMSILLLSNPISQSQQSKLLYALAMQSTPSQFWKRCLNNCFQWCVKNFQKLYQSWNNINTCFIFVVCIYNNFQHFLSQLCQFIGYKNTPIRLLFKFG